MVIRVGVLMLRKLRASPGRTFVVWTDNTTSEDAIKNRKLRDWHVNEEWKEIQRLLIDLQIDLVPPRVPSEDNTADALSRGDASGLRKQHFPSVFDGPGFPLWRRAVVRYTICIFPSKKTKEEEDGVGAQTLDLSGQEHSTLVQQSTPVDGQRRQRRAAHTWAPHQG